MLALGWTPCVGIWLASILMLAGSQETVWQGMLLLFVFSLGFALPFLPQVCSLTQLPWAKYPAAYPALCNGGGPGSDCHGVALNF